MAHPLDNLRIVYDEKRDLCCAILLPSKKPIVCIPMAGIRARVAEAMAQFDRPPAAVKALAVRGWGGTEPGHQAFEIGQQHLTDLLPGGYAVAHRYYGLSGWGGNPPLVEIGAAKSWLKRKAAQLKRVTKRLARKRTLQEVSRIIQDPRVQQGMALASTVYPPLGVTYATTLQAAKMVDAITAGDERAQREAAMVALQAAQAGPGSDADKMRKALLFLYRVKKGAGGAPLTAQGAPTESLALTLDTVLEGWLYNRPYRTAAQAAERDWWKPRSLYHRGLGSYGPGMASP